MIALWRTRRFAEQSDEISPNFAKQNLAEREGFEPSVRFYPYTRLAGGSMGNMDVGISMVSSTYSIHIHTLIHTFTQKN